MTVAEPGTRLTQRHESSTQGNCILRVPHRMSTLFELHIHSNRKVHTAGILVIIWVISLFYYLVIAVCLKGMAAWCGKSRNGVSRDGCWCYEGFRRRGKVGILSRPLSFLLLS